MRIEQPEVKRLFGVVLVVVFVEDNEEWIVFELHRPIIRRNTRSINNHRWTMVSACFYLVFCSTRVIKRLNVQANARELLHLRLCSDMHVALYKRNFASDNPATCSKHAHTYAHACARIHNTP